uniref:cystathionine gamma-lyase n=1 Tax=Hirondellea gigas TaxID=1518452 RepID=A0A2P2I236_9CRUS
MDGFRANDVSFPTRAIRVGSEPEKWNSMAVVPPISLSTTFKQHAPAQFKKYEYSRSGNPTRDCLEECLASLEDAKYGLVFASGLAATTTIMHMLSSGDHVITMNDLYGGTNRYFKRVLIKQGITVEFIDTTVLDNVKAALKPNTKMVWCETPTNPLLQITDIAAVSKIVKEYNKDILIVVDNTFLSPYNQRPLPLGADMVMHSCTKYLNGHSDVVMGAVCTSHEEAHNQLRFLQNAIGGVPSPFDCYLVNRSLKTLAVRMMQHHKNGMAVAKFLEGHPAVERVLHPGLPSHPQHELAKRQCFGHSGMVTFFLKGDDLEVSKKFFSSIEVFTLAESLGGYESLCELPSLMTHSSVSPEERAKLGITDSLIRLSVGLESIEDLISDLDKALNVCLAEMNKTARNTTDAAAAAAT